MSKLQAVRRSCLAKVSRVDIERDRAEARARALWLAEFAARILLFCGALAGVAVRAGFYPGFWAWAGCVICSSFSAIIRKLH